MARGPSEPFTTRKQNNGQKKKRIFCVLEKKKVSKSVGDSLSSLFVFFLSRAQGLKADTHCLSIFPPSFHLGYRAVDHAMMDVSYMVRKRVFTALEHFFEAVVVFFTSLWLTFLQECTPPKLIIFIVYDNFTRHARGR